jgi:hypothetical protein
MPLPRKVASNQATHACYHEFDFAAPLQVVRPDPGTREAYAEAFARHKELGTVLFAGARPATS